MTTGNLDQDQMSALLTEDEENDGMTLVEHLEELRWRILKCLLAVLVGSIVAFVFHTQIQKFLQSPLPAAVKNLTVIGVGEAFSVSLMTSIAAGVVVALPVILYQLWAFISPGLYSHEKNGAVPFIVTGVILFVAGISLGFWLLRYPLAFLIGFGEGTFNEMITVGSYYQFVAFFLLACGISFELPLVLIFLSRIGILTADTLKKKRAVFHIALWLIPAVIMPGADPWSPIILAAILSVLYEATILYISRFVKAPII
jgi:sec-independent protein translocase protein TatC